MWQFRFTTNLEIFLAVVLSSTIYFEIRVSLSFVMLYFDKWHLRRWWLLRTSCTWHLKLVRTTHQQGLLYCILISHLRRWCLSRTSCTWYLKPVRTAQLKKMYTSIPAQPPKKKTEISNLLEFELHRPSSKGTKLLCQVIKAIINQYTRHHFHIFWQSREYMLCMSMLPIKSNAFTKTKKNTTYRRCVTRKSWITIIQKLLLICWRGWKMSLHWKKIQRQNLWILIWTQKEKDKFVHAYEVDFRKHLYRMELHHLFIRIRHTQTCTNLCQCILTHVSLLFDIRELTARRWPQHVGRE